MYVKVRTVYLKMRKDFKRTRWSLVVLQCRIKLFKDDKDIEDLQHVDTYLALASLTRTLGLAKSSRNLWLCSNTRRSRSSDMD